MNFKWFEKIPAPQIKDVKIHTNPGADIKFDFVTDNDNTNFSSILRFGKGTGFSNIRFDIIKYYLKNCLVPIVFISGVLYHDGKFFCSYLSHRTYDNFLYHF